MHYLLDTDTSTLFQRGHPAVINNMAIRAMTDIFVSVITVEEQFLGWYKRIQRSKLPDGIAWLYRNFVGVVEFAAMFQVITYSEPAVRRFGLLRAAHRRIGKNDLRIAAISLEEGMKVVTRNTSDFSQIPGLQIEDWS